MPNRAFWKTPGVPLRGQYVLYSATGSRIREATASGNARQRRKQRRRWNSYGWHYAHRQWANGRWQP